MGFPIFKRKHREPELGLERGWQFYARPNTLETVGHMFRIDEEGVRFPVGHFPVATEEGVEAGVKVSQRIEVKAGMLARFLDLVDLGADVGVGRVRTLEYEIHEPIRVLSTDMAMDAALKDFLRDFVGKKGNRYFVIRQTRSATSMRFRLSADFVADLGGEGRLSAGLKAGASLNVDSGGFYEINRTFPERLLVTFQAERIEQVTAGLAEAGNMGLIPVDEVLEWREPTVGEQTETT